MKHLVVALKRKDAVEWAQAKWPRDPATPGTLCHWETQGETIHCAIYGENLAGRRYDRIWLRDQKKASEAAKQYLMFRVVPDGRFEKADDHDD